MDGTEILYVIFDEFSDSEVEAIAQLFENSDGCKKIYTEDKENLLKIRTMNFSKWSVKFEESYEAPEDDEDDIWSGDINSEDMIFNGDLLEFKTWLNKNKQTIIDTFNLSGEKLKKLDSILI
jgi:hypothetical protein